MEKAIIGRRVVVDYPEIGLKSIQAKVDTGAYTSSIHCSLIERRDDNKVACIFLDPSHPDYTGIIYVLDIVKEVGVRSSNGFREARIMVRTTVKVKGQEFLMYLTLTDRGNMKYPVLVGRRFLRGRFLVDVTLTK